MSDERRSSQLVQVELTALETNRGGDLPEDIKIAYAMVVPEGYETTTFRLSDLDPITKVQEETFFNYVKESIFNYGLYRPVVVHPIHVDDWKVELELDKHQTPPPMGPDDAKIRLRIQTGCNRYYALKELGYDAVEAVVVYDKEEALDLGHFQRIDKKWQRGTNLTDILKKKEL